MQYSITNTLEDQILSKVKLAVQTIDNQYLSVDAIYTLSADERIAYGDKKYIYAVFNKQGDSPFPVAKVANKLQLTITEIDVDSKDELGSYEEDYSIDDLHIAVRDYIRPYVLPAG